MKIIKNEMKINKNIIDWNNLSSNSNDEAIELLKK